MIKFGSFLLLITIALSMFTFTRFIMPVQAGIGTHVVRLIYYKAYIYDDHDGWPRGAGEWYFRAYGDGTWTSYSGEYKRDGPGYVDFLDIWKTYYASGYDPVEFACQAREKDSGWDYTSEIPVIFGMWYTTPNVWHNDEDREGDVKHYYKYMVDNRPPRVDSLSGPDSGEPGVHYTYYATGHDPEWDSITYEWSVDGVIQPSTGSSLTYMFPTAGTYEVEVKTKDYFGAYSIRPNYLSRTVTIREPSIPFDLLLSAGWNMVSFPYIPDDPSFSSILSDVAYYQVLTWDGVGYVTPSTVEAGQGYWVLVLEDTTVTVESSNPVESYVCDLPAGWSMIGSITESVDGDSIFPGYYQLLTWHGAGYVTVTTIDPGKAYWVLVLVPTHIRVET